MSACLIAAAIVMACLGLMALENRLRWGSWLDETSKPFTIRNAGTFGLLWSLIATNIWVGQLIYLHHTA